MGIRARCGRLAGEGKPVAALKLYPALRLLIVRRFFDEDIQEPDDLRFCGSFEPAEFDPHAMVVADVANTSHHPDRDPMKRKTDLHYVSGAQEAGLVGKNEAAGNAQVEDRPGHPFLRDPVVKRNVAMAGVPPVFPLLTA